jgi:hypothetical protein
MEEKLKILFGFFRGLKTEEITTYMNYIYDGLEQWDHIFTTKKGKGFKSPKIIEEILEEVISSMMRKFHRFNNYDEDDFWTLYITIYPWKNKIKFKSECKYLYENSYKYNIDLTTPGLPTENKLSQETLDAINMTFENGDLWKETETVAYEFDAEWRGLDIKDFEEDDTPVTLRLEPWAILLDKIMKERVDSFWKDERGAAGKITIQRNNSIQLDFNVRSEDYDMTDMNIIITLDDF